MNATTEPVTHTPCNGTHAGVINIGLIGQFHYVALEEIHLQQQLNDGSGEGNGTSQSRLDCSMDLSIV